MEFYLENSYNGTREFFRFKKFCFAPGKKRVKKNFFFAINFFYFSLVAEMLSAGNFGGNSKNALLNPFLYFKFFMINPIKMNVTFNYSGAISAS
jgi:hypothetical protein